MARISCPLCAQPREIRKDKNGMPYVFCNECGLAMFIRNNTGRNLLLKLTLKEVETTI